MRKGKEIYFKAIGDCHMGHVRIPCFVILQSECFFLFFFQTRFISFDIFSPLLHRKKGNTHKIFFEVKLLWSRNTPAPLYIVFFHFLVLPLKIIRIASLP